MKSLFDLDNPVMRFIIRIFDCMVLSVLWVVFSLPVITMGAASAALYRAVYRSVRKDEGYLWKNFWVEFKGDFKRTTLAWLPMLAMMVFLVYDALALRTLIQNGNPLGRLYGVILVLICVATVWAVYLAAYCARFQGGVKDVLRYSFYLMMAHPMRSLAVMAAVLISAGMILVVPGLAALLPAVCLWISSYQIEQVFIKHLRPEDAEKMQKEEETE